MNPSDPEDRIRAAALHLADVIIDALHSDRPEDREAVDAVVDVFQRVALTRPLGDAIAGVGRVH